MTSRRGFLGALAGLVSGVVLDPELLLWKPGAKTISIPAPKRLLGLTHGDIITIAGVYEVNPRTGNLLSVPFEGDEVLLLKRFVITRGIDKGGRGDELAIYPPIIQRGQWANCSIGAIGAKDCDREVAVWQQKLKFNVSSDSLLGSSVRLA